MSITAAALRKMADMGLTVEQIVDLAETLEEGFALPVPKLTAGAMRQRRYRERKGERNESVTCDVTRDATETKKVSPTPPSKNQNNLPPIPPLKGGTFPLPSAELTPAKPEKPKSDDLAQRLWTLANKTSRDRSGRPALGKAVLAAIRKGATDAALEASVREHCREQGEFAKGVHRIVEGEHWRDHLPSQGPPPAAVTPEAIARRLQHFRDTGEWRPEWGGRPRDAA